MPFADFRDNSLSSYLAAEKDADALWLFIHIPKTAGSSMSGELQKRRKPYRNICVDYNDRGLTHEAKMDKAVQRFIDDSATTRFKSASGHISIAQARQIKAAIPNTKFFSFVRDPVSRVISDYRYQRTPAHPPYQEFIAQCPTIEHYIDKKGTQNRMFRQLSGSYAQNHEDVIESIFNEMSFVGVLERYPMSFNILTSLFEAPASPRLYARRTESNKDNVVELNPDLVKHIRQSNTIDLLLYQQVRAALRDRTDEWKVYRKTEIENVDA